MDFLKAIQRIVWRFKKFDIIRVNDNDIEAVNSIVDYINETQYNKVQDNIHFVKLYTFVLGYFLRKFNTGIDDPIPHKELHRLLNRPFKNIVYDLTTQLNFHEKYKILELNESEIKKLIQKNLLLSDTWSNKEIEEGLIKQITNFLDESIKNK